MCTVAEILHKYLEHGADKIADALGTGVSNVHRMLNPNDSLRGLRKCVNASNAGTRRP